MRLAGLIPLLVPLAACAGGRGAAPSDRLDEVRIVGRQTESGFGFERERARTLFFEALEHAEAGDFREAAHGFDRLAEQFPGSRFMPPALYDAAICYERVGDHVRAAQRLERLVRQVPESPGMPRARLELAAVYARNAKWDRAERHLVAVLGLTDLRPALRLEALVQRSRLFLSMGRLGTSERLAREALAYEPMPPAEGDAARAGQVAEVDRALMESLRAEATFVQAETFRMRASAVPLARAGERRPKRERIAMRGQLMLEAQRLYFETLRRGVPRWSERAGVRLGILYRDLWNQLPAPVGVPAAAAVAQAPAAAPEPSAALSSEVEALVRRGLRQAEVALRQLEQLDAMPTGFAERVRAEIEGATGQRGAASLGARSSQDL